MVVDLLSNFNMYNVVFEYGYKKANILLNLPFTAYPIKGTQIACPLCSDTDYVLLSQWDRRLKKLPHVKCITCGLIRHKFMPSEDALERYYCENYRQDYQSAAAPSYRHVAKRHAEGAPRLKRLSCHLMSGSSIVDFGCGSGEFIEDAIAAGFYASGFEPGIGYAHYASDVKGLQVENCRWQDYTVETPVDAVTSFHVFEHLIDPLSALRQVQSWLKPDGVIYIEVPDMSNALMKGFGALHMAHTLGFSRYTVELLGAQLGLAVIDLDEDYDIGMIFRRGESRPIKQIKSDARVQMAPWTQKIVHRRFWHYTFSKLKK